MEEEKNLENSNVINPTTKITIAKYNRCSTTNQELIIQNEVLNRFLKRLKEDNPSNTYEVLEFEDYAQSGKNLERKALKKMMELVDKKKIDFIIFTKLDRLARSLQDLLNLCQKFNEKGVKIIAVEQNIDTSTSQGRLSFQILGAFAEFERNLIRERLTQGYTRAKTYGSKSGKPCNRPHSNIDRDGVMYKYNLGMSLRGIAKVYNVSITPIRRIVQNETKKVNLV